MREPDGFRDFVVARSASLVRQAWLLTGDRAEAEDLVQTALVKAWPRWRRLEAPEAYLRRAVVTTFISSRRRRWTGERPTAELPETAGRDVFAEVDLRESVRAALLALPPRQRAVVVLRYYDDLSEQQTADALGCAVGTVKSQTAKALASLRRQSLLDGESLT